MTKVLIASDHAGFELKKFLVQALTTAGYQTYDLGPFNYNEDDDYPLFVKTTVAKFFTDPTNTTGILICRNGVGVCAIANKYKGVRCALSWNPVHAESAKNDDNANFLALILIQPKLMPSANGSCKQALARARGTLEG